MMSITYKWSKKTGIIKSLIYFLFIVYSSLSITAQNFLDFRLKLTLEDGDYKHAKLDITKNGVPVRVIDSKSKYDLELELGVEYVITATKMGYITKSIVVDTRIPKGREEEEFAKFLSEIVLKPQPEGLEVIYTQPVGRITYSNTRKDFDYDKDYSAKSQEMQKKAETSPKKRVEPQKDSVATNPETIPKPVKAPINLTPTLPLTRRVVERTVQHDKLKITLRVVTIDEGEFIYKKEEFSWGGIYFYKDNRNITESTFEKDTR